GSLLPAPFILLFLRPILKRLSHLPFFTKLDDRFRIKAAVHSQGVKKYGFLGLAIFVAIPLPGTGVWSGSIIAAFLDIRFRRAIPAIAIGNAVAGLLIMLISGLIRVML
ncbi:MAG: small multi-drug export protein, partial [Bacillota bacterium]|nr:small multi-drug export protein [Bacillota bacterium]